MRLAFTPFVEQETSAVKEKVKVNFPGNFDHYLHPELIFDDVFSTRKENSGTFWDSFLSGSM